MSKRPELSSANKKRINMKIINPRARKQAASLVTVLVICAAVSFSVAGYLALITQQSQLSTRSQTWNMAITVSEAGVEEGLQQLNGNSGNLAPTVGRLMAQPSVAPDPSLTATATQSLLITVSRSAPSSLPAHISSWLALRRIRLRSSLPPWVFRWVQISHSRVLCE